MQRTMENGKNIKVHCVSDDLINDPGMYYIGKTKEFIKKIGIF